MNLMERLRCCLPAETADALIWEIRESRSEPLCWDQLGRGMGVNGSGAGSHPPVQQASGPPGD